MKFTRRSIGSMTIGRKLFLSFGTAMTLTLLIALIGSANNAILSSTIDHVVRSMSVQQQLTAEISLDFSELLSIERGIHLRTSMSDPATAEIYNQQFLTSSGKLSANTHKLAPLLVSEADKRLCAQLIDLNLQLRQIHDLTYQQIAIEKGPTSDFSSSPYLIFRDQFLPRANLAKSRADLLRRDEAALLTQDSQRTRQIDLRSRWLTNFMLILFFVVGGILAHIVVQSDRTLRQFAADLGEGATQVAAAAVQVSASSQSLAQGASEQAAFIEATSVSAEEINSMARRNTDNAVATASMVAESQRSIEEGKRALDQMVAAMDGVALASKEISKIVKLIDQIAFQTNILALNAAVEAARAGDAGHSFAVVADEVRELAQRSAQAANDTAVLIEDCIVKSQTGKHQVDEVAAAIRSIIDQSARVKLLVDQISDGSREQSRGIDQVSKAVLQMEQVTQGNAASAEQSAEAAKQLNLQFQTLKDIANDLAAMLGKTIRRLPDGPPKVDAAPSLRRGKTSVTVPDELETRLESVLRL